MVEAHETKRECVIVPIVVAALRRSHKRALLRRVSCVSGAPQMRIATLERAKPA
jgi:hypothetical protein